MKKRYAVIMTAAMMTGVMAATALAEGPEMGGGQQMSGPQMPGGSEMSQPPQMEGQQPPQGEAPVDNGNSQVPEMNGEAPQGEAPADNGNGQGPRMNGKRPEENFGFIEFKDYVENGTISQETYDAITKYMEENKPELPEDMKEGERPELPEGAKNGEKPELPEGSKEGERPEMKEGEGPDLLKDLLEAGVITQEEYDTLAAAREAGRQAAPAANQNNESTQSNDHSTGA